MKLWESEIRALIDIHASCIVGSTTANIEMSKVDLRGILDRISDLIDMLPDDMGELIRDDGEAAGTVQ